MLTHSCFFFWLSLCTKQSRNSTMTDWKLHILSLTMTTNHSALCSADDCPSSRPNPVSTTQWLLYTGYHPLCLTLELTAAWHVLYTRVFKIKRFYHKHDENQVVLNQTAVWFSFLMIPDKTARYAKERKEDILVFFSDKLGTKSHSSLVKNQPSHSWNVGSS